MDDSAKILLGQNIKKQREKLKLSQEELAKSIHKSSPAYIALIEAGKRNISTMDLLLLAKELGISVAALVGEKENRETTFAEALRASSDVTPKDRKKIEEYYDFLKNKGDK